jgi:hypothetical protein
MQPEKTTPLDDAATPVIVCGILAGLAGAVVGMIPTALVALIRGDGITMPAKLVAAGLMGPDALELDNGSGATLLGALMTFILAASAGALFAWLRRRETRLRLLMAEGVGFGLVLFGVTRFTLRYLNPTMYEHQSMIALAIAYALFGAALALELPLRVGSPEPAPTPLPSRADTGRTSVVT